MKAPARLLGFAGVLGAAFAAATLAGAALDPTDEPPGKGDTAGHGSPHSAPASAHGRGHGDVHATGAAPAAGGLAVSQDGLTLEPVRTFFTAGEPTGFAFRVLDERGQVLRDEFELESEREMHLIVVRRDTAIYQHLHPRKGPDGTWTVDLELPRAGTYRAFADFQVDGRQRTLATDLFAPGDFRPERLPAPATTDQAGGFDVELRTHRLRPGRESQLTFVVTRGGRPVDDLERYLGAKGHLVALREGDLAYLHVHPTDAGGPHGSGGDNRPGGGRHDHAGSAAAHGSQIAFAATFPTPGRYRLFLQFRAGGEVRTVAYTLEVPR